MPDETDRSGLTDIIERLRALGQEQDRVSFGDIRQTFGHRSFGPFLLVPLLSLGGFVAAYAVLR